MAYNNKLLLLSVHSVISFIHYTKQLPKKEKKKKWLKIYGCGKEKGKKKRWYVKAIYKSLNNNSKKYRQKKETVFFIFFFFHLWSLKSIIHLKNNSSLRNLIHLCFKRIYNIFFPPSAVVVCIFIFLFVFILSICILILVSVC